MAQVCQGHPTLSKAFSKRSRVEGSPDAPSLRKTALGGSWVKELGALGLYETKHERTMVQCMSEGGWNQEGVTKREESNR